VYPIKIPPLRERRNDIAELVYYFIKRKSTEKNISPPPAIGPGAIDQLKANSWPGNVRELENYIERILIQYQGQNISGPLAFEDTLFQKKEPDILHQPVYSKENNAEEKIFSYLKEIVKIILPQSGSEKIISSDVKNETLELEEIVSSHIKKVLKQTGGKINGQGGAAELLNVNPNTLRSKMRKLGLLESRNGK
ncbi:MAG: hypothetical protein KKC46_12255, partial [Proteobacteria bacterium]|nr:hypothetical protein [Pseudomonadota bacterium]